MVCAMAADDVPRVLILGGQCSLAKFIWCFIYVNTAWFISVFSGAFIYIHNSYL